MLLGIIKYNKNQNWNTRAHKNKKAHASKYGGSKTIIISSNIQ